ncbi:MAG: cell division protein FtsW [Candidatus Magasanikbacteria bacterium]|jgi:cell division protein FtsW|nr:cell division protein FtsW [Candidatus Magasanikbacteria bacterium]MBT4315356.1 cell division protein FtsW [Candidatus Magasanikbacteria bacterium]MBT4547229.1 cell division protein FtsW [Candidatus Magasanikbacteria bacterium]MBT6819294.1 cell division protein FtsW [Candidatus Magasanikbacteria bacterium]
MSKTEKADYILLGYFVILLAFGLIMLTSAGSAVGHEKFGDSYFFIKRQLLFGVLPGLFLFFFFSKLDYRILKRWSTAFYILTIGLLLMVFIPGLGSAYGTNAKSWLVLFGYSFQPAEIAKLAMIIFISAFISRKGKQLFDLKEGFLVTLGVGLIPVILVVLQPDIGTVSILFAILFGLLYVGRAKLPHIIGLAGSGITALVIMIMAAPYRAARFMTFLHPELDPQGVGYHINQAFLAIGSGGILGRGLGHSLQKFQYLPEVAADSIYAIIAEEMGFIFAVGLVVLLILITTRGFLLAKNCGDEFGRLLVSGIIIWFATQSFMNIGAMVGIMPLTGVPMPFISHGGTALAIAMGAVGILVSVSKKSN